MIVDDDTAIIGTINFDFRSFYLHGENAVWMYQASASQHVCQLRETLASAAASTSPWCAPHRGGAVRVVGATHILSAM